MRVLGRDLDRLTHAITDTSYWTAAGRLLAASKPPHEMVRRYLTSWGVYPWTGSVRTPTGVVPLTAWSQQDVFTVNEVFFRRDYGPGGQRVVVDVGANIGISAAFFLSRRDDCVVYASEAMEINFPRFETNTALFEGRVHLLRAPLSVQEETLDFIIEPTGRLGGIREYSTRQGNVVRIKCRGIADYLTEVLDTEGRIDLIKVDTEGSESTLVKAIPPKIRDKVGAIVWETNLPTRPFVRWE